MASTANGGHTVSRKNRHWFRFSVRTLLLAIALVAVWLGLTVNRAQKQKAAVMALQSAGGATIMYDYMEIEPRSWSTSGRPSGPEWLRILLGEDYFHHPVYLSLRDRPRGAESWIPAVNSLPTLKMLMLSGPSFTDETLAQLGPLGKLEELHISDAPISDAGLKQLVKFPKLRWLVLNNVPITDAGCTVLVQLAALEELSLYDVKVSDDAVRHLKTLQNLQRLTVQKTNITEQGARELRDGLPNCKVFH